MKNGQMFWGFFCLTLGALFLIDRYDIFYASYDFVWKFWPFIFIIWGLQVMLKNHKLRPAVSALFGIYLALLIYGSLANASYLYQIDFDEDGYVFRDKSYTEQYNNDIDYASFQLNGGAGEFDIDEGSSDILIDAGVKGSAELYSYKNFMNGNFAEIKVSVDKGGTSLFDSDTHSRFFAKLNTEPVWNLYLNMGACENDLDLKNHKIKYLQINTGASNTFIKLGDKYDRTEVKINMGAASCQILIPESSGCKVMGNMPLLSKELDNFIEVGSDYYTKNYKTAENLIKIEVNGAIGEILVDTYGD